MRRYVVLCALVVLYMGLYPTSAETIVGVSPGSATLPDVLRGGYAERYITVTIDSEDPVGVALSSWGDIASWFNYTNTTSVSRENPGRLRIEVLPPTDVPNGNYTGFIRIATASLGGEIGGSVGSVVRAVVDVALTVEITDIEIRTCRAQGYSVTSVEEGDDLEFKVNILNTGNVRLRPSFEATIWNQGQTEIIEQVTLRGSEILPTREEQVTFRVPTDDIGIEQYWAEVGVPDCFSNEFLTFDVLEEGALKSEGILRSIRSNVWASVGETVPILVTFENVGEKSVDAFFEGRITYDERVTQLLTSPEEIVSVGELTNFTFFFTPQNAGKYIISGRVFYDKKRTFESSTLVNVVSEGITLRSFLTNLAYLIIVIFIAYLFFRIRKERRRFARTFRGV